MTSCSKLFEGLDKKLQQKKTLTKIAMELCPDIGDSRGKIMRLIKVHRGDEFLINNADWLEYDISHIRNPVGLSGTKSKSKKSGGFKTGSKGMSRKEFKLYLLGQIHVIEDMKEMIANQGEVSVERIIEILEIKAQEVKEQLSELENS